jgi:ElaB/YqjD/DUF883 family membrane-anchored ribosome-binding protein
MDRRVIGWGSGLVLTGLVCGCAWREGGQGGGGAAAIDPLERDRRLALQIVQFAVLFEATVDGASEEIAQTSASRAQRRAALLWQTRLVERCNISARIAQPQAALLETWALCARQRDYLESGDGRTLFGSQQAAAVRAARSLYDTIDQIAVGYLGAAKADAARQQVRDYSAAHPIRGVFVEGGAPPIILDAQRGGMLDSILGLPLLPFRALGGVTGASSIGELPGAADRFTEVVRGLPEDARTQLELLLFTIEDSEQLAAALESARTIARSSERYADLAERLPQRFREEARALLDEIESRESRLRALLTDSRAAVQEVDGVLLRAQEALCRLDETTQQFTTAGQTWERTAGAVGAAVKEIQILSGRTGAGEPGAVEPGRPAGAPAASAAVAAGAEPEGRPFDILDYERTATAIGRSAAELRQLMAELRALLDEPSPPAGLVQARRQADELLADTSARTRALADHAAWRLGQLAVFVFGLALVFRWLPRRAARSA